MPGGDWHDLDPVLGREALDRLFTVTYEELRRLAQSVRRGDWNASVSPTTLVSEQWMEQTNSKYPL